MTAGNSKCNITPERETKRPCRKLLFVVMIVLMVLALVAMIVINDRIKNPSEETCNTLSQSSMIWQQFFVEEGMCIKNETGFHANGKAMFP